MLSKTSVDQVFIHHFKKCRQLLGALPHTLTSALETFVTMRYINLHLLLPLPLPGSCPWTLLGDFRLSDPSLPTPGKNPAGALTQIIYPPLFQFL